MRITLYARLSERVNGDSTSKAFGKLVSPWFRVVTEKHKKPIAPKAHPEATSYFLRSGGKITATFAGEQFNEAVTALRNAQLDQECKARGVSTPKELADATNRKTIADAVAEFIQETKTLDKSASTIYNYSRAAEQFRDSCGLPYMDEIADNRAAVLAFIQWMRENLKKKAIGQQNGTIRNRLQYLSVFFLRNGIKNPLPKKDWPKVTERDVEAFTKDEVNTLLSKATDDEHDLILFFLYSGFRDDEVAHTFYSDVDFDHATVNVSEKPDLNFRIKNRKQRKSDITLPAVLIERLKARKARLKVKDDAVLIFPNSNGRPDSALLYRLRKAAKRAGYAKTFGCHKFRKTFGTLYGEQFGIVNAQHLLGHADIRTTQKYLARTIIAKSDVENLFAGVGK